MVSTPKNELGELSDNESKIITQDNFMEVCENVPSTDQDSDITNESKDLLENQNSRYLRPEISDDLDFDITDKCSPKRDKECELESLSCVNLELVDKINKENVLLVEDVLVSEEERLGNNGRNETIADERTTDEKTTEERTTDERTTDEKTTEERTTDERTADERTTDERTTDERTGDERTTDERTTDERTTDERTTDEKTTEERTADERTVDERTTDERTTDEKTTDERTADEKTTDERTADERTTDERTTDEKTAREKESHCYLIQDDLQEFQEKPLDDALSESDLHKPHPTDRSILVDYQTEPCGLICESDPKEKALRYLEESGVLRMFQNLAAGIAHDRPQQPLLYMMKALEQAKDEDWGELPDFQLSE